MNDGQLPRPKAIMWFDKVCFVAIAVNVASTLALLPQLDEEIVRRPELSAAGISVFSILPELVGGFLILLVAWFFISRLRSNVARWLLTLFIAAFAALTAIRLPTLLLNAFELSLALTNVSVCLAAATCLFLHEARAWFRRA